MFRILTTEEQQAHRKELLAFINDDENYSLMYNYMRMIKRIRHSTTQKLIEYAPHCYHCLKLFPKGTKESDLCENCMRKMGITKKVKKDDATKSRRHHQQT